MEYQVKISSQNVIFTHCSIILSIVNLTIMRQMVRVLYVIYTWVFDGHIHCFTHTHCKVNAFMSEF